MTDTFDWSAHQGDDERPPIWKADEEGKTLIGTVTRIWVYKKGDQNTPVLHLDTGEDGAQALWASQVQLRRALADQDPQVGDRVKVEFLGTTRLESGNTLKEFAVQVAKPKKDTAKKETVEEPPPDDGEEPF